MKPGYVKHATIPQLDGGGYDNDEDYAGADETPSSSESEYSEEASTSEENEDVEIEVAKKVNVRSTSRTRNETKSASVTTTKRITRQQGKSKKKPPPVVAAVTVPKRKVGRPRKQEVKQVVELKSSIKNVVPAPEVVLDVQKESAGKEGGKFLCTNCKKGFADKSSLQGHLYWCASSRITRSRGGDRRKPVRNMSQQKTKSTKNKKTQKIVPEVPEQPSTSHNFHHCEEEKSTQDNTQELCTNEDLPDNSKQDKCHEESDVESDESDYEKLTTELQPVASELGSSVVHSDPQVNAESEEDLVPAACPKCKMTYRNQASLQKHLPFCMYSSSSCSTSSEDEQEERNEIDEAVEHQINQIQPNSQDENSDVNSSRLEATALMQENSSSLHSHIVDNRDTPALGIDEDYEGNKKYTESFKKDAASSEPLFTSGSETLTSGESLNEEKTDVIDKDLVSCNSQVVTTAGLSQQSLPHDTTIYFTPVMSNLVPTTFSKSGISGIENSQAVSQGIPANSLITMSNAAVTNTVTINSSPVTVPNYGISPFALNHAQSGTPEFPHQPLYNTHIQGPGTGPHAGPALHSSISQIRQPEPNVMQQTSTFPLHHHTASQVQHASSSLHSVQYLHTTHNPTQQQASDVSVQQHQRVSISTLPSSSAYHIQSPQVPKPLTTIASPATASGARLNSSTGLPLSISGQGLAQQIETDSIAYNYNRQNQIEPAAASLQHTSGNTSLPHAVSRLPTHSNDVTGSNDPPQPISTVNNVQAVSDQLHTSLGAGQPMLQVNYPASSNLHPHQSTVGLYGQNLQLLTNENLNPSPVYESQAVNSSNLPSLLSSQRIQQQQPIQNNNFQMVTFQDVNGQIFRMNVPVPQPSVSSFSAHQVDHLQRHGLNGLMANSATLQADQPAQIQQQLQMTHQQQIQMAHQQQFLQGSQYASGLRNQFPLTQFQQLQNQCQLPQGQFMHQSQLEASKQPTQSSQMLSFLAQQHSQIQALTHQQSQLYIPPNQTQFQHSQNQSHSLAASNLPHSQPTQIQSNFQVINQQALDKNTQIQPHFQMTQHHVNQQQPSETLPHMQIHQNQGHLQSSQNISLFSHPQSHSHSHSQIPQDSSTIQVPQTAYHIHGQTATNFSLSEAHGHLQASHNRSYAPQINPRENTLSHQVQQEKSSAVASEVTQSPSNRMIQPQNENSQPPYPTSLAKGASHCQKVQQQQPQIQMPLERAQIPLGIHQQDPTFSKPTFVNQSPNTWSPRQEMQGSNVFGGNQIIKPIQQTVGIESNLTSTLNPNPLANNAMPTNILNQPYQVIQLADGTTYIVVQPGTPLNTVSLDNLSRQQLPEETMHSPQIQNTHELISNSFVNVQQAGNLQNLNKLVKPMKGNFVGIDANMPCIANSSQTPCPCPRCSLRITTSTVADKYRKVLPFPRPIEPKMQPNQAEQPPSAEAVPGFVKTYMKKSVSKTVKTQLANMIIEKQGHVSSSSAVDDNAANAAPQQDDVNAVPVISVDGSCSSQCSRKNPILTAVVRPMEHPLQKMSDQISQIESSFNSTPLMTTSRQTIDQNQIQVGEGVESARKESDSSVAANQSTTNITVEQSSRLPTAPIETSQAISSVDSTADPHRMTSITGQSSSSLTPSTPKANDPINTVNVPTTPTRLPMKRKADTRTVAASSPAKSIKVTLQRKEGGDSYSIKDVSEVGGSSRGPMRSLKIKAKITSGEFAGTSTDVVVEPKIHVMPIPDPDGDDIDSNLTIAEGESPIVGPVVQTIPTGSTEEQTEVTSTMKLTHRAVVVYEVKCNETILFRSSDVRAVWSHIFETVQGTRVNENLPPLSYPATNISLENKQEPTTTFNMLGLTHRALQFLLQHLPKKEADKHQFRFHQPPTPAKDDEEVEITATGCARTEGYTGRKPFDMFGWLASKHRKPLDTIVTSEEIWKNNGVPMAIRFRTLKEKTEKTLMVMWSTIHGRGLYTRRAIEKGEMIIEYAGEVIRSLVCDQREKYYETKGIGCYMFRINDEYVIDATMKGNAARFINHSCDPNCESKTIKVFGKEHILIFALRKISSGEELTYDYKFEKEDDKIPCSCASKKCRKYLN